MIPWQYLPAGLTSFFLESLSLQHLHDPPRAVPFSVHDIVQCALLRLEFAGQGKIEVKYAMLLLKGIDRVMRRRALKLHCGDPVINAVFFFSDLFFKNIIPYC